MTAVASVSSQWIPEDDLLLKNSIEAGASLEALAKGAVTFSRRFTFRELRDRWHSLLYDPDVSAQASARMAELELSGTNPSSKSSNLKVSEKISEKRKIGSVHRHYYAMRKRIKNNFFNSQNLGFFEERNNLHNYSQQEHNGTNNHGDHGGNAMIEDCLANNLGFEEKDFEILRQAFPESIGAIATTNTATVADDNPVNAFLIKACHKSIENDFINGSFDQNIEMKNATCIEESDPTQIPNEDLPKTDKSAGFGGKHHFNSPVSDGSASFHTMGFSSPSTRLPLWKTLEDVSAPDMPVDENKAEETLTLPNNCDHITESKNSPLYDGPHLEEGQPNGEYIDLPDSLLNFSNEDDILFMDDDLPSTQQADVASPGELKEDADVASTSVSQPKSLQLTEGKIICILNKEDPDIPCNDDIFLLIHPSTLPIGTDSGGPLSSSSHEKDVEQGLVTERKGKDLAPCFTRSNTVGPNALTEFVSPRSLAGSAFKRESSDSEYQCLIPGKPNNLRIPSQTRSMHTGLEMTRNGLLEENASKVELRGLSSPAMYNEMPLPLQLGSVKMIDQESMDDSYIDENNFDSDGDIPYFSDVEAMILEMDLAQSQESCITSEVANYQNEEAKRMIIRLEQAAHSSFQRSMSSHGALAIFYGRRLKQYIKKTEVTIGRSTDDTEVDIDLRKEGRANKISRRQAIIKMETDGSFSLKNLGSSSISLNGKVVAHGQLVALASSCLIEIRGMSFVFEINEKYVRRFLNNQPS